MDWENERYVRVYTRDTADLLAIGWEGRAVLWEAMRKCDRAGVLEADMDVLPELLRLPREVVSVGWPRLLERGIVTVTNRDGGDLALLVNFLEAQESSQTDKQRQKESRARRREKLRREQLEVTSRDESVTNREANVTPGHATSHAVTLSHAEPSLAEPTKRNGASAPRVSRSPDDEFVQAVLSAMRDAVRDVTRGQDKGPRDCKGNRKLIRDCTKREGATLDDWLHVIGAQRESVRHNPEAQKYLALSTICRSHNWLRLLDAPRTRGSPRKGSIEPSTQDHEAEVPF